MNACGRATVIIVLAAALLGSAAPSPSRAGTLGNGTQTIAGVLGGRFAAGQEFPFRVTRSSVLFASLEASVFQSQGREKEHEEIDPAAGGEEGGCGGGTGGFRIEIFADGPGTEPLCFAERPVSPGWQRDPRLACLIEVQRGRPQKFFLRVSRGGDSHHEGVVGEDVPRPYLLHVRLDPVSGR